VVNDLSSALDAHTGQYVAIKKIRQPFGRDELAKRAYREFKLLGDMRHDNVRTTLATNIEPSFNLLRQLVNLYDIFITPSEDLYASIQDAFAIS
jgi:serine/threonine protein kinase